MLAPKKKVVFNKEWLWQDTRSSKNRLQPLSKHYLRRPPRQSLRSILVSTSNSDCAIIELIKELANLILPIQANTNPEKSPQPSATESKPQHTFDRRRIWCDSISHVYWVEFPEFREVRQKGLIVINADIRIVNTKINEEIPPIFNEGGMKVFAPTIYITVFASSSITLEISGPIYDKLGTHPL